MIQPAFVQCVHKKKKQSQLLLALRYQTKLNADIFWHGDLRDNCESAHEYVFQLTCVMPVPGKTFQRCYILATDDNSQTAKLQILSINSTHSTLKTAQNVLKTSTMSLADTAERRRRHWLMDATTIEWSSFLQSTNSLFLSSARRH